MLAIGMAVMGIVLVFAVLVAYVRRMIPQKPSINLEPKKKKEIPKMSDQQKESVTFNDIFMFMIAVPLVLLWVGFAGYVIWHGLRDPTVLTQIEGYTTLIAILGGPALLIIKDALDVWKQEQAEKTAFYKIKAQAVIDYNDAAQKQAQMIEAKQQDQEHKMENKK
jgi:flagellar basal body-associated protein FliL|tara:strand:- start:157 stop:651 length:495 start_codon:yes stop_codon:yes gene_type:complete